MSFGSLVMRLRTFRNWTSRQGRISDALDQLAANPYDKYFDVRPLTGRDGEFRLRVGKYRIIYTLDDGILLVFVVTISPRGDVYKR